MGENFYNHIFRGSSMVEQGAVNAKVAGSSPARGAILRQGFGMASHVLRIYSS